MLDTIRMTRRLRTAAGLAGLGIAGLALAHSPVCSCFDNGDGTITCEGGFSDGASAAGVALRVVDANDRVLIDGTMDEHSTFTFMKPTVEYHVVFDAGQSHVITIYGGDITE